MGRDLTGVAGALLSGWRVAGIATLRSGYPLTVFVQNNRSRSQWQPSLGPGIGRDRPSYAPGFGPDNAVTGDPEQWFNPAAFVLQPAGTFGNTGRGDLTGPDLRTVDLAFVEGPPRPIAAARAAASSCASKCSTCSTAPTSASPKLIAFAGAADERAGARQLRPHPQHGDVGAADAVGAATAVLGGRVPATGRPVGWPVNRDDG